MLGKLFDVQERDGTLTGRCRGSGSESYTVTAKLGSQEAQLSHVGVECSCPSGVRDAVCKHGLALLLWRLQPEAQAGKWHRMERRLQVATGVLDALVRVGSFCSGSQTPG